MIDGVLLEPSLPGLLFPEASAKLFSQETRGILYVRVQLEVGLREAPDGKSFQPWVGTPARTG
jgi:hypothetical protein